MKRETVLIFSGLITCLFALILIVLITYYAIKQNIDIVFYFLFMPSIIFIIGVMILRHGLRLKKKP